MSNYDKFPTVLDDGLTPLQGWVSTVTNGELPREYTPSTVGGKFVSSMGLRSYIVKTSSFSSMSIAPVIPSFNYKFVDFESWRMGRESYQSSTDIEVYKTETFDGKLKKVSHINDWMHTYASGTGSYGFSYATGTWNSTYSGGFPQVYYTDPISGIYDIFDPAQYYTASVILDDGDGVIHDFLDYNGNKTGSVTATTKYNSPLTSSVYNSGAPYYYSYSASSGGTLTLSDMVTWSDVSGVSFDISQMSDGMGGTTSEYGPDLSDYSDYGLGYATGTGSSDNTKYMRRYVLKYRSHNTESFAQTYKWKEVTRNNKLYVAEVMDDVSGDLIWTNTSLQEENLDVLANPYTDEFGDWQSGSYNFNSIPEKEHQWNYSSSAQLTVFYVDEYGFTGKPYPRTGQPFSSEVRVVCDDNRAASARVRIRDDKPSGTVTTSDSSWTITSGSTSVQVFNYEPYQNERKTIELLEIRNEFGVALSGVTGKILYKNRTHYGVMPPGWLPFGYTPYPHHTFYANRRFTQNRQVNMTDPIDDYIGYTNSISGTGSVVADCPYDPLLTRLQNINLATIISESGSINGQSYLVNRLYDKDANDPVYGDVISSTLAIKTNVCPTGSVSLFPVDHNAPDTHGYIVTSSVITETVSGSSYGEWRTLEAPRGCSIFIEKYI